MTTTTLNPMEESTLVSRLRELYTRARDEKRSHYPDWERNYKFVKNRSRRDSQNWKPNPKDSEMYPSLATIVAWAADQNTTIDAYPAGDPHSPFTNYWGKLANDLASVIQTNWLVHDFKTQIKLAIWDSLLYEVGIFKCVWDQQLDGGLGNAVMRRVDPWSIYVDPEATSFDDAEYIIEARRMSYAEIERRWPETFHKLDGTTDGLNDIDRRPDSNTNGSTLHNLGNLQSDQTTNTRWAVPTGRQAQKYAPDDGAIVYEFWCKENDQSETEFEYKDSDDEDASPTTYAERRVFETWRVIVVCGNQILMDEPAKELWSHGSHPYERFVWDDIGEFYGVALADHISSPQTYINRLLTALQHNTELTGNPVWIEPTNSGIDRAAIVNKPGQRLRVRQQAMQTGGPRWADPPKMSSDVPSLIEFWISRIDNATGMSAAIKGAAPTSRTAEGVLTTVQEAAFVRIRNGLSNLESTLRRVVYKLADLIIDNYTEPRYMAILGPTGQQTSLALSARHFHVQTDEGAVPLKYIININAGAGSPTSRQARIAEADTLFAMGALDIKAILEAHNYPNRDEIAQRIQQLQAMGAFNPPGARQRARRQS